MIWLCVRSQDYLILCIIYHSDYDDVLLSESRRYSSVTTGQNRRCCDGQHGQCRTQNVSCFKYSWKSQVLILCLLRFVPVFIYFVQVLIQRLWTRLQLLSTFCLCFFVPFLSVSLIVCLSLHLLHTLASTSTNMCTHMLSLGVGGGGYE